MAPQVLFLLLLLTRTAPSRADPTTELEELRSKSPSGVIHLDDHSVSRFLTSVAPPRPYTLVIFFDAAHLHSNTDLHLPKLRSEFALLSAASASPRLFFCDLEFAQSQRSFSLFGVSSLPHLRIVNPNDADLRNSIAFDQSDLAGGAESMAAFLESKIGVEFNPINRPPLVSGRVIALLSILAVVLSPFIIKRILSGETLLHDPRIWMAGAIFVYFFSVSGGMFNVIRGMPMFMTDRANPNKFVFFYQGSGMQLGAEGFSVGFLYVLVGLLMAVISHGLVGLKSLNGQRLLMGAAMIISIWAVKKVIFLDNWKTGYGVHGYWPTSWR